MATIKSIFTSSTNIIPKIVELVRDDIGIVSLELERILREYLNNLRTDISAYIEYPYVDKVYRDSYYKYYSTKHYPYSRNCIRVALFEPSFTEDKLNSSEYYDELVKSYLGFFVIRPIPLHYWGRCILKPTAFLNSNFICCLTEISSSIKGFKLNVGAFPHTSQDSETYSCAETTIWEMMEYFGTRYPEYKPILPSRILDTLSRYSYERQVPSGGLTSIQISYVLKAFDFGTKIYDKGVQTEYPNDFNRIVAYYIESGIPIIASIVNPSNYKGHAIILIGREIDIESRIEHIEPTYTITNVNGENLRIIDSADIEKDYVIIDDNHSPYKKAKLDSITNYYSESDSDFRSMELINIIVPLYPKIYSEATQARRTILNILKAFDLPFENEIVIRLFLTSSRSFKSEIIMDDKFDVALNRVIIDIGMPKFVWVCELSDKSLFKDNKSKGLIVLDATDGFSRISLIFILLPNSLLINRDGELIVINISFNNFSYFKNNLKGDWCGWRTK